jgi:hypothetical protein
MPCQGGSGTCLAALHTRVVSLEGSTLSDDGMSEDQRKSTFSEDEMSEE